MKDMVSIVLPVYNGERYLRESIESVLNQTYSNWELLLLDDCSDDRTPLICKEYTSLDDRIKYYRNEQNLRLPRNLNKGFSLSNGAYLTWTSDDNNYYPEAIERMVLALETERKEFVFCSCDVIDGDGKIVECIMVDKYSAETICGRNPVGACFMYTRNVYETIGEYNPEFTLVEDYDYWQRICAKFSPTYISEKLYAYRWHEGALTSTMRKEVFNKTLEKMLHKNISSFGKLSPLKKFYYYEGLHKCCVNLGEYPNEYTLKYKLYYIVYLLRRRVPAKIKRMFRRIVN